MAKSDRWTNAGDQMPYIDRDRDRDTSNKNAQRKAGWYSDEAYMTEVGKEGIKRQQEKMRQDADDQEYPRKRIAGKIRTGAGASGRTGKYVGGKKKTTKKRVAGK